MVVLRRRTILIFSTLFACVIAFAICFSSLSINALSDTSVNKIKVVLDAGHGGVDGGVSGIVTGVKESELNLKITKKVEKILIASGFEVVLTRNSDAGLYGLATGNLKRKDMEKRREIIHKAKPDLVISIHLNKFSVSDRRGAQVFFKESDDDSKLLAQCIQSSFNDLEESTRNFSALKGEYYILNCSDYPSVIAECGFLSNPNEESLLISDVYQEKIAWAIYEGISSFLIQATGK